MATANHDSNATPPTQSPLTRILSRTQLQPISVLNEAVNLAYDARNLEFFANPQLVPSCVYLMVLRPALEARKSPAETARRKANMGDMKKQASLYTLMCAQVISLSVQVSLLGEGDLAEYLESLSASTKFQTHGPSFLSAFSSHVARIIHAKLSRAIEILSELYKTRNAVPTERVELPSLDTLGQANAELLLWFLYDERDMILAARRETPTCWQGWSVLMYQLWIYIRGVNITKRMTVFLRDLICRFGIVNSGDPHEDNLLLLVENSLEDTSGDGFDDERNRPLSYDDAYTMVSAYVERFSSDKPPRMRFSVAILRWILHGLTENPNTKCMLIEVVDGSLARAWRAIESEKLDSEQKGLIIDFTQHLFMDIHSFLKDKQVPELQKKKLVKVLVKHDILDFAGRVILLITIGGATIANVVFSQKLLTLIGARCECFQQTFEEFGKRHRPTQEEFDVWARVLTHVRRMYAHETRSAMIMRTSEEWWDIGISLGFNLWGGWPTCSWPRCPAPHGPVWLACEGCDLAGYCSIACQVAHWTMDPHIGNHKAECEEMSKMPMQLNYTQKSREIGKYDETWVQAEESNDQNLDETNGTDSNGHDLSDVSSTDSEASCSGCQASLCEI